MSIYRVRVVATYKSGPPDVWQGTHEGKDADEAKRKALEVYVPNPSAYQSVRATARRVRQHEGPRGLSRLLRF